MVSINRDLLHIMKEAVKSNRFIWIDYVSLRILLVSLEPHSTTFQIIVPMKKKSRFL